MNLELANLGEMGAQDETNFGLYKSDYRYRGVGGFSDEYNTHQPVYLSLHLTYL